MVVRRWLAPTAGVIAFAAVLLATPVDAAPTSVRTAVGLGLLVAAVLGSYRGLALTASITVAALTSLTATVVTLSAGSAQDARDTAWGLLEVAVLLSLIALGTRWARDPAAWSSVALAATAQTVWILPYLPDYRITTVVAGLVSSGSAAVLAAGVGAYLQLTEHRTERSVAAARARQRRQLERDLHDYVAHDLSGIIAEAQAARFAASDDPSRLLEVLARIEAAGHQAMDSMDRALELLRADDAAQSDASDSSVRATVAELAGLVDSFAASTTARVVRDLPDECDGLPQPVSVTLHRATVEALTNVRRHALHASEVRVRLVCDPDSGVATLEVNNSAEALPVHYGRAARGSPPSAPG